MLMYNQYKNNKRYDKYNLSTKKSPELVNL